MLITVIFYSLPLIFVISSILILVYRETLINVFGKQTFSLLLSFAILYLLFGTLGFILVLFGYIDFMVYWIIVGLIIIAISIYTFWKLYQLK